MCAVGGAFIFAYGCNVKGCSCAKNTSEKASAVRVLDEVEMLSKGSEPRVELRVARWSGLRYRVVLESTGSAGLEGQPSVQGPAVTMTLENEVLRGSADPIEERHEGGVLRLVEERSLLTSVTMRHDATPPPIVEAWNRALLPLRGTTSRQKLTEGAAIASVDTELVGGVQPPDEVKKALDGMFEAQRHFPFRLPSVPVGIGARWRFREKLVVNGVHAAQVADMSLRAIDADTAVVALAVRQEAPKQEVPHPFAPGQKATVDVYRSDGEGEITIDRLTAIPLKGRLASTARLTLSDDMTGTHRSLGAVWTSLLMARGVLLAEDAGKDEPPPE